MREHRHEKCKRSASARNASKFPNVQSLPHNMRICLVTLGVPASLRSCDRLGSVASSGTAWPFNLNFSWVVQCQSGVEIPFSASKEPFKSRSFLNSLNGRTHNLLTVVSPSVMSNRNHDSHFKSHLKWHPDTEILKSWSHEKNCSQVSIKSNHGTRCPAPE